MEERMINKKILKNFEVTYTAAFSEDEEDAFIAISAHLEEEIEKVVFQLFGAGHQIGCNFVMTKRTFYIIVDEDIKIKARMTGYKHICDELLGDMNKLMQEYDITPEELQNMYRDDEALKNDVEIYNHKYQCKVVLSIEDTDAESFDKARSILDAISFQRMKPRTN